MLKAVMLPGTAKGHLKGLIPGLIIDSKSLKFLYSAVCDINLSPGQQSGCPCNHPQYTERVCCAGRSGNQSICGMDLGS